jgi:hypothetical protein
MAGPGPARERGVQRPAGPTAPTAPSTELLLGRAAEAPAAPALQRWEPALAPWEEPPSPLAAPEGDLGLDVLALFAPVLSLADAFGGWFADWFAEAGAVPGPPAGVAPVAGAGTTTVGPDAVKGPQVPASAPATPGSGQVDDAGPGPRRYDASPAGSPVPTPAVDVAVGGGPEAAPKTPGPATGPSMQRLPLTPADVADRTEAAVAALPEPAGPDPDQVREPVDAVAQGITARGETDAASRRRSPASIVRHRPTLRAVPRPDPSPVKEPMAALGKVTGQALPPAVLPEITASPRGTWPDLSRRVFTDLELRAIALGDAAILQLAQGSDPESIEERRGLAKVREGLGGATDLLKDPDPIAPEPVAIDVQLDENQLPTELPAPLVRLMSAPVRDEQVVGAGLSQEQQVMFAMVVADLRSDPDEQGRLLMKSVRQSHSRFPGGELDQHFSGSPLTGGMLPQATSEVAADASALAASLALTPEQLDRAVQLRKRQVHELREKAAGMCIASTEDAAETAVQADKNRRGAARQTVAGVKAAADADRTVPRPPRRTQRRVEKAMADLNSTVSVEMARLDEQLRLRERAVADAIKQQVSAIRLAQVADEIALQPKEGTTRGTVQDWVAAAQVRRWADAYVASLNEGGESAQAKLMATARAKTEEFRVQVRDEAAKVIAALRLWGAEHTKAKDTWWADLDAELGRWYGTALSSGVFWANQQGQASRIALAQDFEAIQRIGAIQAAGANKQADAYIASLDKEALAVLRTLSGGGKAPDLVAALSAGLRGRVRSRHQTEWEEAIEKELMSLPVKDHVKDFQELVKVVQPNWDASETAKTIHGAVARLRGHDEETIFEALSGLTPLAAELLKWTYEDQHGQSLEDALVGYGHVGGLTDDEMDTAHQLMKGDRVDGAVGAIHSALMGAGSEMGAVNRILRSLKPAERLEAVRRYQLRYGVSLEAEFGDQWSVSTSEAGEAMALARSDSTGAAAIALKATVITVPANSGYGGYGAYGGTYGGAYGGGRQQAIINRKAAAEVYGQIRKDVETEAAAKHPPWRSFQIEAEITLRSRELGVRFDEMAADEWWVKNQPPGTTATQAAFALTTPAGKEFLEALATNDLVKLDVAKLRLEDEGLWAGDAAINAVFRDQASRSVTDVQRDLGPILQARTEQLLRQDEPFDDAEQRADERMKIEQENAKTVVALADKRTEVRMGELGALYQEKSGRSLTEMVEDNMSFTSKEEALARVAQRGVLTNYQKLKFAIEGLGTDEPMLRATLATMSKDELIEANKQWMKDHDGETLSTAIKDDTSGREQGDLVDMAENGAPQTSAEIVEAAARKLDRDQKAATLLGGRATRRESEYAARQVALLRTRLEEMRRTGTDRDAQLRAITSFEIAVDSANTAIEIQREALDEITDMLANAAAIVTAIVVGALLAPFTAGGSAIVAAAIISSVVATGVSILVKQAMKGSYYGRGELATDLAVGAVDAIVSALTAGLGRGLLGRAAGKMGGVATGKSLWALRMLSKLGPLGRAAARSEGVVARGASKLAFLEGMGESKKWAVRMVAKGTSELLEQGVQAVPSVFTGALFDERIIYDPDGAALLLENTVMGTVHSTAMGLGMAVAHHYGGKLGAGAWHAIKSGLGFGGPGAPPIRPSTDILARQGTPADRLREFRAWKEIHPEGTLAEFTTERTARAVEASQLAELRRQRVRDARAELLEGLAPLERGKYADLPVHSVGEADFARLANDAPGDAALVESGGQAVIVVREGAAPGAVAALLPQVRERVFPGMSGLVVEAALPKALRDTPIRIDITLPRDEIRVRPVPATGKITGVEVVVGPGVHPIDVALHAGEVARVRGWMGRLGDGRMAAASLLRHVGLNPVTPEDRVRFEAAGEVRKLEPIIDERIHRMLTASDPVRANAEALRVMQLMAQHERYRRVLKGEIQGEAKGYVAQEGEPSAPAKPAPTRTDAAVALRKLREQQPQLITNLRYAEADLARVLAVLSGPEEPAGVTETLDSSQEMELNQARIHSPAGRLADAHAELLSAVSEARRIGLKELPDIPQVLDLPEYLVEDKRLALRTAVEKILKLPRRGDVGQGLWQLAADTRRELKAYDTKLADLTSRIEEARQGVARAQEPLTQHEAATAQWAAVVSGADPASLKKLTDDKNLLGVPSSPLLPRHKCPDGYVPHVGEGGGDKAWAHWMGLVGEAHMANRIAEGMPGGHTVVDWGDIVGSNGYDAFSVDANGMPHFWDSKYRSAKVAPFESDTFTVASRIQNAIDLAVEALNTKPGRLTPHQVQTALAHLGRGEFVAYTMHTRDGENFHAAVRAEYQKQAHAGDAVLVPVPWNHGPAKP